jgi:CubicO group peptidase (beta-lactamase class C family)
MLRSALIVIGFGLLSACAAAAHAEASKISRSASGRGNLAESKAGYATSDLSFVSEPKSPDSGLKMDNPDDLAPMLQALAEKYQLPGAVGAILHGDKIVALGSTGVREKGDPSPFLVTDSIHLGSDTKAMTAILIGQLIDRKQLTFDTTMAEIFPDLARGMNPLMARNTVRNLLDQAAGFPHDLDSWWSLDASGLSLGDQRHKAVEQALSAAPATPIGTFSYSNISFVILGAIIEAKTGKSWEDAMRQKIFGPLHMTNAGFGAPGMRGKVDQPWGHVDKDGTLQPTQIDNPPVLGPAGTVHCSMSDWSRFIAEILRGAQGHPTLVSAATFKELITPLPSQDYAGGWIIAHRSWAGGLALTHAGSNGTWYCNVWIAPNKNFAFLIATNCGGDSAAKAADEGIGELIQFNLRQGSIDP